MKKIMVIGMLFCILINSLVIVDADVISVVSGTHPYFNTLETLDKETGELTITDISIESGYSRYDISLYYGETAATLFPVDSDYVKSVVYKDGINYINKLAFYGHIYLENVKLPDTLVYLGDRAFINCIALKGIEIPKYVSELNSKTFYGCNSLSEVVLPKGLNVISDDCFMGTAAWNDPSNWKDEIFYLSETAICISDESKIIDKEIVMMEDTDTLNAGLFKETKIRAIKLPEGIESISDYVGNRCEHLVGVYIPDSVTEIGDGAFRGCPLLTIYCSKGSYAEKYAKEHNIRYDTVNEYLYNAPTIEEVYTYLETGIIKTPEPTEPLKPTETLVPTATPSTEPTEEPIESDVISKLSTDDIFYATLETLDKNTGKLEIIDKSIIRGESRMDIYTTSGIYSDFPFVPESIKTVVYGNGINRIGEKAFYEHQKITSVTLPDTLTYLGSEAFYGCTSLSGIEIPEYTQSIGDKTFYGCTSLTRVILPKGLEYISANCFLNTPVWENEDNWENGILYLSNTAVCPAEGEMFTDEEISLRNDTDTLNCAVFAGTKVRAVYLPEGIESVPDSAFKNCKHLVGVYIPDSVTEIGWGSFEGSSLLTIYCSEGSYAETYAIENNISYDTSNEYLANAPSVEFVNNLLYPVVTTPPTKVPQETTTSKPTEDSKVDIVLGDINSDGFINAEDALLALKNAAKLEELAWDALVAGDINMDKAVDSRDALDILRYSAGLLNEF